MSDKHPSLASSLNYVWGALTLAGVKHTPRVVFEDLDDWMIVLRLHPWPEGNPVRLAGFPLEYGHKPVNEADRFIAQEIGA